MILFFLHNGSATLIPALALPFSIFGTFAVMQVLGFSLDNLSMMALILSIGFVVDDAIVMLENVVRHIEHGETRLEAALKGSAEIGSTIVTMTVSLTAVFIPILFMGGILGRLFREFAVTIAAAILISGVVSVTLTPMLCSRFLSPAALQAKRGFAGLMERLFNRVRDAYASSLAVVLRHRPVMLGLFVLVLAATVGHVRDRAEGLRPGRGQRLAEHQSAGGARHVIRRHGGDLEADCRGRAPDAVRRYFLRQHRRRDRLDEPRAHQRAVGAARTIARCRRRRSRSSCASRSSTFPAPKRS